MKCQIAQNLLASKEDEVETRPAEHGGTGIGVKELMIKGVNHGKRRNRVRLVQTF